MSFTCTRYDDSIPCEASPNYFYLNKRNGDPKAYFLTDEDISSSPKQPFTGDSFYNVPHYDAEDIDEKDQYNGDFKEDYKFNNNEIIKDDSNATIMDTDKRSALINSVFNNYDPVDANINMGDIYDVNNIANSKSNIIREQSRAPYEFSPKISNYNNPSSTQSVVKFPGKYEPATKVNTYVPLNSHYVEENKIKSNFSNNDKFSFTGSSNKENYNSNIPSIPEKYFNHREPLKSGYLGYSEAESLVNLEPTPATPKKTTFTPALFSQLYMENQQKAKQRQQQQRQQQQLMENPFAKYFKPTTTIKAFDHLKQEMIPIHNKSSGYTESLLSRNNNNNIGDSSPLTKYDQYSNRFQPVANNNQYVVPSAIRIIPPPNNNNKNHNNNNINQNNKINLNGENNHRTMEKEFRMPLNGNEEGMHPNQPVKISFMNHNRNSNQNHLQQSHHHHHRPNNHAMAMGNENESQTKKFINYGNNYKVVKQVKGKNLLIDPSLENDPARDNIIAQVLEMLSKYN